MTFLFRGIISSTKTTESGLTRQVHTCISIRTAGTRPLALLLNGEFSSSDPHDGTTAAIVKPTKACMFVEQDTYPAPSGPQQQQTPHRGGALAVFADGHVKQFAYSGDLCDNILCPGWGSPYEPPL